MDMELKRTLNWTEEMEIVSSFENMCLCKLHSEWRKNTSFHFTGQEDLTKEPVIPWSLSANQTTVSEFSAICWYFGKEINKWWMTVATYNDCLERANKSVDISKQYGIGAPKLLKHSRKWPIMIYPLTSMTIYGAIMYQGESDSYIQPHLLACNFQGLINDWRRTWFDRSNGSTNPRFPFGFVQI
jgi:sialate O-acetylesterase